MVQQQRRRADRVDRSEATDSPETQQPASPFVVEPSRDDVARRAYQLYEERGGEHGRDQEDWFEAERELQQFLHDAVGKFLALDGPYVGA